MPVYFMQCVTGGPIKIGHSEDVDGRRKQLEGHYGRELAVLATMPGGPEEEAEVHGRFAHLRFKGRGPRGRPPEQFRPAAELMAFIGRPLLVGPNPDAVEAMDPAHSPDPTCTSIKFDKTLAGKARLISQGRGVTMTEYLSEMTRAIIDRDYAKLMRELEGKKE